MLRIGIEDEGSLETGDVQQLVSRLGSHGTGNGPVQGHNGDLAPVGNGGLDDLVPGHGVGEVRLQQLLDLDGVRTQTAQEGGRLEGTVTGADIEILGVQENARQQALGLDGQHIGLFHGVQQQLRHQLRSGGGIGLVEIDHHGTDVVRGPAVMVDDGDLADGLQQRLALHLVGTVGVHHDENGIAAAAQQRILAGDQHAVVLRHGLDLLDEPLGGIVLGVNDDPGGLLLLAAHTGHTQRRTHGIEIRVLVAHDVNIVGFGDELHHGVGIDTGADFAPVLHLLVAAAVEVEVQPILDDRLVTAAAQAHLHRQGGKFVALLEGGAVHTQTKGDGGGDADGVGDAVDLLQNGEFARDGILQIPLFKDQQVAVALHAPQKAVVILRPGGDDLVEAGIEVGGGGFGEIFGQLLIVVDEDDGNNGTGAHILVPDLVKIRQIGEVEGGQHGAVGIVGPDGIAEDPVAAVVDPDIGGILLLARGQPVHFEVGHQIGDLLLVHPLPEAAQIHEGIVGPDQRTVGDANQRHGEGCPSAVGVAQGVGGGLDVGLQLPTALELAVLIVGKEEGRDDQLNERQLSGACHQGGEGKNEHHDKKQIQSRLQKSAQLSIHPDPSVNRVFLPIVIHSTLHYSILKGIKQQLYMKNAGYIPVGRGHDPADQPG